MQSLYSFKDYREVLRAQIEAHQEVWGYQGKLAEAAKCQKPYLSNVLSEKANLNSEQAMRLALYWQFSPNETDYFLELVNLARTDFPPLRARIKDRLSKLKSAAQDLGKKYPDATPLYSPFDSIYYSSWVWSAIHVIVGIPGFQTVEAISERLNISKKTIQSCLSKLEEMKLVKCIGNKWAIIPGHTLLPKESAYTSLNHANWRQRAILASQSPQSEGVHYTCVQTHTHADFLRLKELVLDYIDKHRAIVKPSEREEITTICIDFFKVQ